VKNVPSAWNPSKWKPVWSTPTINSSQFNADTDELKAAFGAE
jgi:hypothetical protein